VKLGVGGESDGAELVGVAANEEGRQGLDLRGRVVDFMGGHGCDLWYKEESSSRVWAGHYALGENIKQNKNTLKRIFKYDIFFKKKNHYSFQEIEYFSKNASKN